MSCWLIHGRFGFTRFHIPRYFVVEGTSMSTSMCKHNLTLPGVLWRPRVWKCAYRGLACLHGEREKGGRGRGGWQGELERERE